MTIDEIQSKMSDLRALASERGEPGCDPRTWIGADGFTVSLGIGLKKKSPSFFRGDNADEVIAAAFESVSAWPDADEAGALRYRTALADALEVGRAEAIADEFTAPVRSAMDTFTERALPNYAGEALK